MNRNSLDFLLPMFPFSHFSQFSILIVNQTQTDRLLVSDFPNVRVVNSFEKGLSKSRNTAIRNASKAICLIADDDVVYRPGFEKAILEAFHASDSAIITFNHQRIGLPHPQNTSEKAYLHNAKTIWEVCSIEIAFRLETIQKQQLFFNEYFGLGAFFETAEEMLLLRKALQLKIKASFNPFVIESHPLHTSGEDQGSDTLVFARAGLSYKLYGIIAYFWLPKYLFFLLRHQYIGAGEILRKFGTGLSGIQKYKQLASLNEPTNQ